MATKQKITGAIISLHPVVLALLYIVFALVWIFINEYLLIEFTSPTKPSYAGYLFAYLLLLAVTAWVINFIIKARRESSEDEPLKTSQRPFKSRLPLLIGALLTLVLLAPVINYSALHLYTPKIESQAYDELQTIAKLKAVQLDRWLIFRKGDVQVLSEDEDFAAQIQQLIRTNDAQARRKVTKRFDSMLDSYALESTVLLDADLNQILVRGEPTRDMDPSLQALVSRTKESNSVQRTDFYLDSIGNIQLDILAPVKIGNQTSAPIIAYILVRTGPARHMIPRLLAWPSVSESAEAIMVQQVDNTENIIKAQEVDPPKSFVIRRPTENISSIYGPSSQNQQGRGYLNRTVYVSQADVPDSSWRIFAQIDKAEVLAPLKTLLTWVTGISLGVIACISLLLIFLWNQQRKYFQLQMAQAGDKYDSLLKRFFDLPFIGMAITDPNTKRWLRVNQHITDIFGYSADEFANMTWPEMTVPEDLDPDLTLFNQLLAGEIDNYRIEKRFFHKDGHQILTRLDITVVRDLQNVAKEILVVIEDITQQRQAAETLKLQEEFNRVLLENQGDAVVACDANMNLVVFNRMAREWHGLDPRDIPASEWANHYGLYDGEGIRELTIDEIPLVRAYRGEHLENEPMTIKAKGQPARYLSCSAVPFYNHQNVLMGAVAIMHDLTERRKTELEVKTLNRYLLMLTNINQTIVRDMPISQIFEEACKVAVRDGGFKMAWIGMVNDDRAHVDKVAIAGETGDYLENLVINLNDENQVGPTLAALRTGKYVVSHDVSQDVGSNYWKENALRNHFQGMIALPLKVGDKVVGNFSLYTHQLGIFNERETTLLDELANDISYALSVAATEAEKLKTQLALKKSESLFQTLATISPVGILRTDAKGNSTYVNQQYADLAGVKGTDVSAEEWYLSTHPDDRDHVKTAWEKAVASHQGFSHEFRFLHQDGRIVWVKGQVQTELDTNGEFIGFVATVTDITAIKNSEEKLRMSAAVFEHTREGIMVTDANNRIVSVNRAFTDITLFEPEEVIGKTPRLLASERHQPDYFNSMWSSLKEIGYWQGEIWNRRKNGEIFPSLMSISAVKNDDGEVINHVGVFADISTLKASEEKLEFLAHHDPLTKLPNRLMLVNRLNHAIEVSKRENKPVALMMLDLDRFKNVNDSFGHLAGDELLQQVAGRLKHRLRGADTVSRLGGDEFTVVLEDLARYEDAAKVGQSIITELEKPWRLSNNIEVRISASVGISIYPEHGTNTFELLQHADAALYQAKAAGRGCVHYFSESLTKAARDRFDTEAKLRKALSNHELRVYYQPKVDINTSRIIGAEALVRWQDPEEGLIMPGHFIGIAEETGLINQIGEFVLREACRQTKQWHDQGLDLNIAVNLSAHQLYHSDIQKTLSKILKETKLAAKYVELELTESTLMLRESEIIKTLEGLRKQGVSLAIDDFGTGYSSLAYLKTFPVDVLKIDRSFVDDIEGDEDDRAITATIIGIAHTLGLKVVAEGVETETQLAFLRKNQCDLYQGYLMSKPIPADEFETFFKRSKKT